MHLLYAKFTVQRIKTYLTYAKITIVIKSEIISLMLNIPCYLINTNLIKPKPTFLFKPHVFYIYAKATVLFSEHLFDIC